MACLSTLDVQSRLDVQELLSRFCYAVDHEDRAAWLSLFASGAVYSSLYLGSFTTAEEIGSIPALVREKGEGAWRHHFTNIILDRQGDRRHLLARAFLTTRDCAKLGEPVRFSDCVIHLRQGRYWQILRFEAKPVGERVPVLVAADSGAAGSSSNSI